ncbi:MAG: Gfo/Idh/MocA family oxidoreductase [Bacteroidales bacterium]|nr:Gfo/Idh/MocA family oxidoreductase [Bacteroidales bacterium]
MIKVLIIGLGSIGQRHAKALLELGLENVAALRTNKGSKQLEKILIDKIKMFSDEEDAFAWKPTHVVISNPTSLHKYYVAKLIEKKIRFFVEKPVAENIVDISDLLNEPNIEGIVGYNLRFHGVFQFVKSCISSQKYGRIITAQLHVGQYLPDWHPYEDYRKAYYSRKDLGGGAIRTLSHEIDLMQYFFGEIKSVFAKVSKLSDLEIDVDDVASIQCEAEFCKLVNVHINFLDPVLVRKGSIYFEKGLLQYDFVKKEVSFIDYENKKNEVIYSNTEDYNLQYKFQMAEFVGLGATSYACSFNQGINVMKIIEKCEESNLKNTSICLI